VVGQAAARQKLAAQVREMKDLALRPPKPNQDAANKVRENVSTS
jgi:hypothetical protein